MKTGAKFYTPIQERCQILYTNSRTVPNFIHQFKNGAKFYTPIQERCQILYTNSRTVGTKRICKQRIPKNEEMWMKAQAKILGPVHKKISHMRAANDLARLHICAVSPEPSLIALKRRDVNEGSGQFF